MTNSEIPPYRQSLQVLLHQRGYHSYDELAQAAEISRWHLLRLERGLFPQIPVGILMKLAITLGEPLDVLIKQLSLLPPPPTQEADSNSTSTSSQLAQAEQQLQRLQQEYQRLTQQKQQQAQQLLTDFQRQSLDSLEPWLLQWPTAAAMAQQTPDFPAQQLLPLIQPVVNLLKQWQVSVRYQVGETVLYDPQWHQWFGQGTPPTVNTPVVVRYVGYQWQDRLLYRAKVDRIADAKGDEGVTQESDAK